MSKFAMMIIISAFGISPSAAQSSLYRYKIMRPTIACKSNTIAIKVAELLRTPGEKATAMLNDIMYSDVCKGYPEGTMVAFFGGAEQIKQSRWICVMDQFDRTCHWIPSGRIK